MKLQAFSFAPMGNNTSPPLSTSLVKDKIPPKKPTATLTADVFQATAPTMPQNRTGSSSSDQAWAEAWGIFGGPINSRIKSFTGDSRLIRVVAEEVIESMKPSLQGIRHDIANAWENPKRGLKQLATLCTHFMDLEFPNLSRKWDSELSQTVAVWDEPCLTWEDHLNKTKENYYKILSGYKKGLEVNLEKEIQPTAQSLTNLIDETACLKYATHAINLSKARQRLLIEDPLSGDIASITLKLIALQEGLSPEQIAKGSPEQQEVLYKAYQRIFTPEGQTKILQKTDLDLWQ